MGTVSPMGRSKAGKAGKAASGGTGGGTGGGAQTPGNPNDPWALASGSYDEDTFFTRATDGNGHSSMIHVKVSPALMGQLVQVRESNDIPAYRTNADIVRDALIHRLHYLSHHNITSAVDMAQLELEQKQAMLDRIRSDEEGWSRFILDLDERVKHSINRGDFERAQHLLDQAEVFEDVMTDSYLRELNEVIGRHAREIRMRTGGSR